MGQRAIIAEKASQPQQEATSQPIASASTTEIEQWLDEQGETADHLIALGVDQKVAEEFTSQDNFRMLFPKWVFARTGATSRVGVLFLPCDWSEVAYIFVLQNSGGKWRTTDQAEFDCHYDDSVSMEVVRIRNPNLDEILVHHACGGHGTGYLEQNFNIFNPVRGKLDAELEVQEVLNSFPVGGTRHDLQQRSTFTIIPLSISNSRAVEETRSGTLNGKLTVERRVFRWDERKERYVPRRFSPVSASTN